MIPRLPGTPRDEPPPLVVVAEPDSRLAEVIAFALRAHHFRVVLVDDGERALQSIRTETPDLVVAEVHLSRRSGHELCELLRRDLELPELPILLLSAAATIEARVEALAHGADDTLVKPFSPKELVARAQRLVARARTSARHRARSAELERELARTDGDARRAREEAARERARRSLAEDVLARLLRTTDLDELDAHLLREVCRETGARSAVLLARDARGVFVPAAVRGAWAERWAGLELAAEGVCAHWLTWLGRPIGRGELERLPERSDELGLLAVHGVALLAPVGTPGAVEAIIACEDRADGMTFDAEGCARMGGILAAAAPARLSARRMLEQQERALDLLAAPAAGEPLRAAAAAESAARLIPLVHAITDRTEERERVARALSLGPWAWSERGRAAMHALAGDRPTRRMTALLELLDRAAAWADPDADRLAQLVAVGLRYQTLRLSGRSAFESWRTSGTWIGAASDPQLRTAFPELLEPVR